jgi:hypothetical protein
MKPIDYHPLNWEAIQKLNTSDAVNVFRTREATKNTIYGEQIKIVHLLKTKEVEYTPLLRAAGISPGSISNAAQGSRVFAALVIAGLLEESAFDKMSFPKILAVNRAQSGKSARKVTDEEVVNLMKAHPPYDGKRRPSAFLDYEDELESIFETGLTLAEVAEQKAIEAAAKAAAAEAAAGVAAMVSATADESDTAGTAPTESTEPETTQPETTEPEVTAPAPGAAAAAKPKGAGLPAAPANPTPANVIPITSPTVESTAPASAAVTIKDMMQTLEMLSNAAEHLTLPELEAFYSAYAAMGEKLDELLGNLSEVAAAA